MSNKDIARVEGEAEQLNLRASGHFSEYANDDPFSESPSIGIEGLAELKIRHNYPICENKDVIYAQMLQKDLVEINKSNK